MDCIGWDDSNMKLALRVRAVLYRVIADDSDRYDMPKREPVSGYVSDSSNEMLCYIV